MQVEGKLLERLVWDVDVSDPREILPILLKKAELEKLPRSLSTLPIHSRSLSFSSGSNETVATANMEAALKKL